MNKVLFVLVLLTAPLVCHAQPQAVDRSHGPVPKSVTEICMLEEAYDGTCMRAMQLEKQGMRPAAAWGQARWERINDPTPMPMDCKRLNMMGTMTEVCSTSLRALHEEEQRQVFSTADFLYQMDTPSMRRARETILKGDPKLREAYTMIERTALLRRMEKDAKEAREAKAKK